MPVIARNNISAAVFMFIIALFLIIFGVVLTVSLIFIFIGIPLLIIGIILLIASIIAFFSGTIGGISYFLRSLFKIRAKQKKSNKKQRVIDVHEEDGVYR